MAGTLPAAALLLLAPGGCGSETPPGPMEAVTVEMGELELLPAGARFVMVREVVLSGGAVWVLDGAPPFVTRVSLPGGEVLAMGGEGQGPGEFLNPQAMQPAPGPEGPGVRVWDFGTGRVTSFDAAGTFQESVLMREGGRVRARTDIRQVSYVDPFRIRAHPAGVLAAHFPARVNRTADVLTGSLYRAGPELAPDGQLASFADHGPKGAASLREWTAVPLWDACGGTTALWSPDSSRIAWLDPQGRPAGSAPVEVAPGLLELDDIERYLRHMARLELGTAYQDHGMDFARLAAARRDLFARERPLATDLRCQAPGIAWLQLFDTARDPLGRGPSWLRVPLVGAPRTFTFPVEFTPFAFTAQGVYGALETPGGLQRLARWRGVPSEPQPLAGP